MNRHLVAVLAFVPLMGCAASSDPSPTTGAEADYTSGAYADAMRAACLRALPELPAAGDASLDDAQLAELGARPELARGQIQVFHVTCSTRGYGAYETPSCARIASREQIDTNYSPSFRIEQHESYRDVVARIDAGRLVLATAVPDGGAFRPTFTVDGSPDALHATMQPPQGWTMPDDLQQVGSYAKVEFAGAMTNGTLTLAHTEDPVVTWNVAQCTRAVMQLSFDPAKGSAN
jgi:hypothetical protein